MKQIKFPILITNFKTYPGATGQSALTLAKIHKDISENYGVNMAVSPQATDIYRIASNTDIPVFAQHVDCAVPGQFTGHVLPEAVKAAGASGTILNHAERRIPFNMIADHITRAREVGLFVVVCAKDIEEAKMIAALNPDAVAIEPPELIGGDVSVSTASPEIIEKAVKEIPNIAVIVGAGVKTGKDIEIALRFGAKGILLASGITKSKDPRAVLEEMAKSLAKKY